MPDPTPEEQKALDEKKAIDAAVNAKLKEIGDRASRPNPLTANPNQTRPAT